MKSLMIPIVAVCAVLAAGAEPAGPADRAVSGPLVPPRPPPRSPERVRPASCLIKVSCDPMVLPMGVNTLNVLLNTSGVANQTARELFGERQPDFEVVFSPISSASGRAPRSTGASPFGAPGFGGEMGMPRGGPIGSPVEEPQESVFGLLEVTVDAPGGAEKLMNGICERLRTVLNEAHEAETKQLQARIHVAEEEMQRAQMELRNRYNQRRKLEEEAGGDALTRESIQERSRQLNGELQKVQMEQAGMQARREALQKRIAETTAKVQATLSDEHPMIHAQRLRLEALREKMKQLETLHERGTVAMAEVLETKAALAAAEAELQQQIEQVKAQAGGEQIRGLNEELAGISIETTEREARLAFLKVQLEKVREQLARADEYEIPVTMELPLARQFYELARVRLEELQRQARVVQPPVVTVIGSP